MIDTRYDKIRKLCMVYFLGSGTIIQNTIFSGRILYSDFFVVVSFHIHPANKLPMLE